MVLSLSRVTPTHMFGATATVLICLAVWPWVAPISPATPSRGENTGAPAKTTAPPLPPPAAFAAIGERPLFSVSRRPSPASKAPAQTGGATRYRLLGLMTVGATRRALVADGTQRIEVSEGTALDRWTVSRIDADRVVLSGPAGQAVLELQRAATDPAPTKPR